MADVIGTGAGTITKGQRPTSAIAAARKVTQWLARTVNVSADVAPLYQLIKKMGINKTIQGAAYIHLETDYLPISATCAGSETDSTTTIDVTTGHGVRFTEGTVFKCLRTGEMFRVESVSSDALTVATRGFAGTTAYALVANDIFAIISHSANEGDTSPDAMSSEPTIKTNYAQIFKQPFELTGRDIESEVYGPPEAQRVQKDATEKHLMTVEMAFMFGNGIKATDPYITGGIPYWVTTNVTNAAGALTETTFNTFIRDWMRRNHMNPKCVMMAGELACQALDGFGRDGIEYRPDDKMLGIACGGYRTTFGEVKVVRHGLMSRLGSDETAANNGWQGMVYGLNMGEIGKCTFKNRGMKTRQDIETPGTDGKKWEILEDCGLYIANEKSHAILTGITG